MESFPSGSPEQRPQLEWLVVGSEDEATTIALASINPGEASLHLSPEHLKSISGRVRPEDIAVLIRDPEGGEPLAYTRAEIAAFIDGAQKGEFDHLAWPEIPTTPQADEHAAND